MPFRPPLRGHSAYCVIPPARIAGTLSTKVILPLISPAIGGAQKNVTRYCHSARPHSGHAPHIVILPARVAVARSSLPKNLVNATLPFGLYVRCLLLKPDVSTSGKPYAQHDNYEYPHYSVPQAGTHYSLISSPRSGIITGGRTGKVSYTSKKAVASATAF
jgi:hypothetical protein